MTLKDPYVGQSVASWPCFQQAAQIFIFLKYLRTSADVGFQAFVSFAILLPASDLGVSGSGIGRGGGVVNLSTGGTTNVDVPCNSAGPKGLSSSIADDVAAAFSGAPPTKGLGGCMALPEAEPVAVVHKMQ